MRLSLTLLFPFIFTWISIGQIMFDEVADEQQVKHSLMIPTVGAGVSFYDFNQDGLDDLTLATLDGRKLGFYINKGGEFEEIDALIDNEENAKQILWVDFDNDDDADLFVVSYFGYDRLYENTGDLNFQEVTVESGLPTDEHLGYGACWGDYNRDGWLDLYFSSRDVPSSPNFKNYNRLFLNNADGTFSERTYEAMADDQNRVPFCAAFLDYNNDMWPDLYIANDKLTYNTLLKNRGDGTFEDVSEVTNSNLRMNSMCVNVGDVNQDGWSDIYVTNTPVGNGLLLNSGLNNSGMDPVFEEVAAERGVGFYGNGWGSNFLDADNDGDLDLYVSGSIPGSEVVSSVFYENTGGGYFEHVGDYGFGKDTVSSFSNAVGDINNDGLYDIMVHNNPPTQFHLWQNHTVNENNWLKVELEGVMSNRDGIGVKLEAYAGELYQSRFTHCGFGFLGQNSSYTHLGLGTNEKIDSLILTWPSGHIDRFLDVGVNDHIQYLEGQSTGGVIHVSTDVEIIPRSFTTPTQNEFVGIDIRIFPNPGDSQIHIDSPISTSLFSIVEIMDVNGHVVSRQKMDAQFLVNVPSELALGVYWIRIKVKGFPNPVLKKWIKLK